MQITNLRTKKSYEYTFIERTENLCDWSGRDLDNSVLTELDIGGCVRISIASQERVLENIYFVITGVNRGDNSIKFKGYGADIYHPYRLEFIGREFEFEDKHITEIFWKNLEDRDGYCFLHSGGNYCCDVCENSIYSDRYHCKVCYEGEFDICKSCFEKEGHQHEDLIFIPRITAFDHTECVCKEEDKDEEDKFIEGYNATIIVGEDGKMYRKNPPNKNNPTEETGYTTVSESEN